jgi:hypothetical protein
MNHGPVWMTLVIAAATVWAVAQPATQPASEIDRLLGPDTLSSQPPVQPLGRPANAAPAPSVRREGTFMVDRVGRLAKSSSGQGWEFVFESDGRAMEDPPVIVLQNLKLMAMEDAIEGVNRDLRFRVTGMLTEYRNQNYMLIEKVVVLPDSIRP